MESHKINVPNYQPDSDDSHFYLFGGLSHINHINVWALHSHLTRCENPFFGHFKPPKPPKTNSPGCAFWPCGAPRWLTVSKMRLPRWLTDSKLVEPQQMHWGSHPAVRPGLKTFAPGLPTETQLASDFHAELSGNKMSGFSVGFSKSQLCCFGCLKNQHCPQAQIHQMVFSEIKVPITPLICHWLTY